MGSGALLALVNCQFGRSVRSWVASPCAERGGGRSRAMSRLAFKPLLRGGEAGKARQSVVRTSKAGQRPRCREFANSNAI
jgi:hypothetical protein